MKEEMERVMLREAEELFVLGLVAEASRAVDVGNF